jgi:hypothetical protein
MVGFHGMVSNYRFARREQGFEKVQDPNAARPKFRSQCGKQKEALCGSSKGFPKRSRLVKRSNEDLST